MTASEPSPTRYRFGPLERRGLVAGWRGGQIGAVAFALVIGVGVLRASSSPLGVVAALATLAIGVGVATWPIAGRTAEEWTPDALRHVAALGRRSGRGPGPFSGIRLVPVDPGTPTSDVSARGGLRVGVLHDRSRRTFTAVFGASDPGFVLLGEEDKVRRVTAWSGVLGSLARQGSAVHRVQWVERVVPGDERVVMAPPDVDGGSSGRAAARASYAALLECEASTSHHDVLVAVTIHAGKSARSVKSAGGADAGACTVLLREAAALRRRLSDASIDVGAVLSPDALATVVRDAYHARHVPRARPAHAVRGAGRWRRADPGPDDDRWLWPMGVVAEWGSLRTDSTWHATYWVAEWPRTDTGPDFLGPVLLPSDIRRSMSVVMEPLGPIEASRKVEKARTADIADAELRRRGGFLATARRRREEEILVRREVELADGHAHFRFSGYLTVGADDRDALEEACGRVEQAAGQAGLELRRCYGDQANTFLCTLPLGRGLC